MKRALSVLGHLLALGVILLFFFPVARAYYQAVPPFGADFLNYSTYVAYIRDHLRITPASWKYTWFSGFPLVFDSPWLHFYLALPLTKFLSAINAFRLYMMLAWSAQLVFSYLLLYQFARNRFVSMVLTIALASSVNFYLTLFGGGTAGSSATRMFLPLTLLLLVKYFQTRRNKYLLLAGLSMGLSCLGHVGSLPLLIFGPATLFFFFWQDKKTPLWSWKKIWSWAVVTLICLLVGGATLYRVIHQLVTLPDFTEFGLTTKIRENALSGIYDYINPFLIPLFVLFGGLALFRKKIRQIPEATSLAMLVFYVLISGVLYITGHHPLSQAMGPDRIWWILSLALACLIALFWRILFPQLEGKWLVKKNLIPFLSLLVFIPIFWSFSLPSFKEKLEKNTSHVGYPSNIQAAVINEDKAAVETAITPSWMDAQSTNYRYYALMPAVITWWNTIFPLPLVKGYYHSLSAEANNWLYWVDNTLLGEYVWHFGVPEEIAKQHALFLMDWYSVRYFEGGGLPLAPYLEQDSALIEAEAEVNTEASEPLKYYKFFDEVTSPIIRPTNSPAVLMVGNTVAYDVFLKILATENLNSRFLIPVHGPKYLEELENWDLNDFEAIFLYSYEYRNEKNFRTRAQAPWDKLEQYVKSGGKLIIETGEEVMESDSSALSSRGLAQLPAVFPVDTTTREALGEKWDLTISKTSMTEGIKFAKFSELLYESSPWKLSYANNGVRPWAKAILNQKGKPVLAEGKLGQGKVIWSGINLPYHFLYHLNLEEAKLFRNLLGELVSLTREGDLKNVIVARPEPEEVSVTGQGFAGVVFKETFWPGWQAWFRPQAKKLKVYRAGPWFMYVRLPEKTQGEAEVNLVYRGSLLGWFLFFLSLTTILAVLLAIAFQKLLRRLFLPRLGNFKEKLSGWWEKEDE